MVSTAASPSLASDPLWLPAQVCLIEERVAAVWVLLESEFASATDDVHAHLLAAQTVRREDRIRDGARRALDAAHAGPDDPETLCAVIAGLLETGETVVARECLDHSPLADGVDPVVLMRMAGFPKRLAEHAESLALLDMVREAGHETAALRFRGGKELAFNGRPEEAGADFAGGLAQAVGEWRRYETQVAALARASCAKPANAMERS